MTTPSLPQTRPTSDTYGPDLADERPVSRPNYELSSAAWNQLKADVGAIGAVITLLRAVITNNGTVAVADAAGVAAASITVTRVAQGHVQIAMPSGIVPRFVHVTPRAPGMIVPTYGISGVTIDVYTYNGLTAALGDYDFSIEVS